MLLVAGWQNHPGYCPPYSYPFAVVLGQKQHERTNSKAGAKKANLDKASSFWVGRMRLSISY